MKIAMMTNNYKPFVGEAPNEKIAVYLPIIAIRVTGVYDVVEHGQNGMLSDDSIEKWANNLIYVLKHKNVFTGMKLAARKTALRYNEK